MEILVLDESVTLHKVKIIVTLYNLLDYGKSLLILTDPVTNLLPGLVLLPDFPENIILKEQDEWNPQGQLFTGLLINL